MFFATRPELDHLAVRLAEFAIAPVPIHPSDLSPIALVRRFRAPNRAIEARTALDGLVSISDRLPDRIQDLVVAIAPRELPASIQRVIISGGSRSADAAIRLAERYSVYLAAPGLLQALQTPDDAQSKRAAHALLSMSLQIREPESKVTPDRVRVLQAATAQAAWGFETHRNRNALLAALVLIDHDLDPSASQIDLRRLLLESDWAGHSAIRSALRHSPIEMLRGSAWRWLRVPQIASAALDRVSRAETRAEHESVLSLGHLAIAPERARVLRAVADHRRSGANLGQLLPEASTTATLSPEARVGRVRLVSVFNVGSVFTRSLLEDTPADPNPSVRLAAVRALGSGVGQAFLVDSHRSIARSAATAWSLAGIPGTMAPPTGASARARLRAANAHRHSPHTGVRRIAQEEFNRLSPWDPSLPASRVCARRWLSSDAKGFTNALLARLHQSDSAVAAIVLAQRLALVASIEHELLRLVNHTDPRVAATAVAALGHASSADSLAVIDLAMTHPDDRVRANALEARVRRLRRSIPATNTSDLMLADSELHATLIEFKDTPAHRVRAAAVRALLEGASPSASASDRYFEPKAAQELERMLTDDRPMHRVSGLWVAQHVLMVSGSSRLGPHWNELTQRVAQLANDAEPSISQRAKGCSARLHAEIRQGNSAGAAA